MTDRRKGSNEDSGLNPYEIWQEKQAAIETAEIEEIEQGENGKRFVRWLNPIFYLKGFWSSLLDNNRREAIKVVVTTVAAFGLILTIWDSHENRRLSKEQFLEDKELTQQRLITDRFTKSTGLLSDKDKAVRIAAIFALERIAKDSPQDHWTIMELLSAYIIENSPLPEANKVSSSTPASMDLPSPGVNKVSKTISTSIPYDIQSAINVIGRREAGQDEGKRLDLSRCNLSSANLKSANLGNANLHDANLSNNAFLNNTNLSNANLHSANLRLAILDGTNLSNANLRDANLRDANLSNAIFLNTDLHETKNLTQSHLEGKEQPLICNSPLPQNIEIDYNRDCGKVATDLVKSQKFLTREEAEEYIQEQR